MFRVSSLLACLALACTDTAGGSAAHHHAIYGGEPAPLDDDVFSLDDDAGSCTATLIAPRTLLTAAHCVDRASIVATNGPRRDLAGDAGPFIAVEVLPYAQALDGGTADLALVLLDRAPAVRPRAWEWWGPPPALTSLVRHVGYGRQDDGSTGERRSVRTPVSGATEARTVGLVLLTGSPGKGLCYGDSGGPVLSGPDGGERVVAVQSFITQACGEGMSSSVLLFPYRDFIERWLARNEPPQCARDGRCVPGCEREDPDCRCGADGVCQPTCPQNDDPDCPGECRTDGVCTSRAECPMGDDDCIADGQPCLGAGQCGGRRCVNDPQNPTRYCSMPCDAQTTCPVDLSCDGARGVCISRPRPTIAEGGSCASPLVRCATGLSCTKVEDDSLCLRTCQSQVQCLEGTRCTFELPRVCRPVKPLTVPAQTSWEGPLARGCHGVPEAWPLGLACAVFFGLRRRRQAPRR